MPVLPPHLVLDSNPHHRHVLPDYNKIMFYLPTLWRISISSSLLTAAEIEIVDINMDHWWMISTQLFGNTWTLIWLLVMVATFDLVASPIHSITSFSTLQSQQQAAGLLLLMCYSVCLRSSQDTRDVNTATF